MRAALLLAVLMGVVLCIPASHAALQDWNVDISLNEDRTTDWVITYMYDTPVQKSDFFVLAGVSSFNVTADEQPVSCTITRAIGSSIECLNLNAKKIVYKVTTFPGISPLQGLNIFSTRLSITQATPHFSVIIRLPFGMALAEETKLEGTGLRPFEPAGARQESDGRRIFAVWGFEKPELGDTYDFTVVYEPVGPTESNFTVFVVIIAAIIIAFLVFLVFFFRRRSVEELLPVLTEGERKVMEIILREKRVDQRLIVKETDFSKAKASRIIHDLQKRGLIDKQPKGRTNIITLKKVKNMTETAAKDNVNLTDDK